MESNISVLGKSIASSSIVRVKPLNEDEFGVPSNHLWKVFHEKTIALASTFKMSENERANKSSSVERECKSMSGMNVYD
jgi:hypothetical protein